MEDYKELNEANVFVMQLWTRYTASEDPTEKRNFAWD